MEKNMLIGELFLLHDKWNWSGLPSSLKIDYNQKAFLQWCLTCNKGFNEKNKGKEGFLQFLAKISRLLDLMKSEAHLREIEKRERNELASLKDCGTLYAPKKFSVEDIEKARRNKSVFFPWRSNLKDQVQHLQEILKEYPEAIIDHDYDYTVIITGKDTFEETETRLKEEEQKKFELSLKKHNRWAKLSAKYGD